MKYESVNIRQKWMNVMTSSVWEGQTHLSWVWYGTGADHRCSSQPLDSEELDRWQLLEASHMPSDNNSTENYHKHVDMHAHTTCDLMQCVLPWTLPERNDRTPVGWHICECPEEMMSSDSAEEMTSQPDWTEPSGTDPTQQYISHTFTITHTHIIYTDNTSTL